METFTHHICEFVHRGIIGCVALAVHFVLGCDGCHVSEHHQNRLCFLVQNIIKKGKIHETKTYKDQFRYKESVSLFKYVAHGSENGNWPITI